MSGTESVRAATIAVLPFDNLSADPAQDYFARGFVEEITTCLARFAPLAVLHPRSAGALAERGATLDAVDYRLAGSLRRDGETLRVTAQLESAGDGRQIWADRYDASATEALSIQDDIAASVASALALKIDSHRLDAARRRPLGSLQAYDCWLRGMDHLRRGTVADDDAARALFLRALEIDPHYARAYAGISMTHFNEWSCQAWALWDQKERLAYEAARRAVELQDDDAMIHVVLARIQLYRRHFDESERHLERALELNVNDADALAQAALCYGYLARGETAAELADKAMRLNPFHDDWYFGCAALARFATRNYDEGLALALKAPRATVDLPSFIACGYARAGQGEQASQYLAMFLEDFRHRILFGREPEAGEPLRWLLHVNPFRHREDSEFLAEGLRMAGLEADPDEGRHAVAAAATVASETNTFTRDGETWLFRFDGDDVRLSEVKGFIDIAQLLATPDRELHCLELAGRPAEGGDDVLDARARDEIAHRIRDLQTELDEAEAAADLGRQARTAAELDALVEQLSKSLGLGGRSRAIGSAAERARSAVTWRIRSAIKKIEAAHPRLGRHLDNSIKTGAFCSYRPDTATDWHL